MTKLNGRGSLRLVGQSPAPVEDWVPPPMPLCLPLSLKAEYLRLCKNLYAEGLWHDDRMPIIINYLSAHHVITKATASLSIEGVIGADGKPNPAIQVINNLSGSLVRAGAALGLTVKRDQPLVAEEAPSSGTAASRWAAAARGDA